MNHKTACLDHNCALAIACLIFPRGTRLRIHHECLWLLIMLLCLADTAWSELPQELRTLQDTYANIVQEMVNAPFLKELGRLNEKYTGALKVATKAAKITGNLEEVIAMEAGAVSVAKFDPPPPIDSEGSPARLKKLRDIYRKEYDVLTKKRQDKASRFRAAQVGMIKDLETKLTKVSSTQLG